MSYSTPPLPSPTRRHSRWSISVCLLLLSSCSLLLATQASMVEQHTLTDPSPSTRYPSLGLSHLEPVQGYKISHADNWHLHSAHEMGALSAEQIEKHSNNPAKALAAHSSRRRTNYLGMHQPFPEEISVEFYAFERKFALNNMQIMMDLYVPHSKTTVMRHEAPQEERTIPDGDANSSSEEIPNTLQSYWYKNADEGIEATVTVREDGLFHGLINTYSSDGELHEMFQVDPLHLHEQHTPSHVFSALSEEASHGMVAFKYSDLENLSELQQCASAYHPEDKEHKQEEKINVNIESLQSPTSRKLLYALGEGVTRWTSCYPGDTTTHKVSMGIAADVSYYQLQQSSVSATQAAIAAIFTNINLVYRANFNVFIQLDSQVIQSTTGGPSWNQNPPAKGKRSSVDPTTALNSLTSWRGTAPQRNTETTWHQLTNVYPPSGVVGIAWIAVLCSGSQSAGLSSYTSTHWLVAAHEIGHNFGGNHDFQLGQGTTGGVMDYGNGQYPLNSGIYQFRPTYNQAESVTHTKHNSSDNITHSNECQVHAQSN